MATWADSHDWDCIKQKMTVTQFHVCNSFLLVAKAKNKAMEAQKRLKKDPKLRPKKVEMHLKSSGNVVGPHPVPMDWTLVTLPLPPMIPLQEKRQLTDREAWTRPQSEDAPCLWDKSG